MSEQLEKLEEQRNEVVKELAQLRDFRAGSITVFSRRCGKPGCRCARKGDPGHGSPIRLTYKLEGKTVTESLPDRAAVKKAQAEIAEFRRFQELSRKLIEVNLEICRLRPIGGEQENGSTSKKNRKRRSSKKSGRK
jgi:hypothetical protein